MTSFDEGKEQKKKNEMSILRSPKKFFPYKRKNFVLVKHREWRRCDNVFYGGLEVSNYISPVKL